MIGWPGSQRPDPGRRVWGHVLSQFFAGTFPQCTGLHPRHRPHGAAVQNRIGAAGGIKLRHETAGLAELPYATGTFDAVYCISVLEHLAERGVVLREFARVLAPGERHPEIGLVYPVHLNPNVREPVERLLCHHARIALIEPLDYVDFVWMLDRCLFALSDSGGVQEEAPSPGKPVLVLRELTERPEGVEAGTCLLVGTDPAVIVRECSRLLDDPGEYARRSTLRNPYGDGRAAERIVTVLEAALTP